MNKDVRCPRCDNIIYSYDAEDDNYLCDSGASPCGYTWEKNGENQHGEFEMKRKMLVNKLLTDAYSYMDTYGDSKTCMVLLKRAIEEIDKEKQTKWKDNE